ncbi:MAG: DEAD/DEAH box helicase [Armatimonadota bacterium]|nr:DEAD/DEAH box helicase [Armatimonadota bacterium]MCX7778104.1 DEAD/DEAH box helicase [Armatimonadota bacterium]MDW8026165.1 DEAD/DEAH box helicase [Armatimonadota bacterium]
MRAPQRNVEQLLSAIRAQNWYGGQIVHFAVQRERAAEYGELKASLHEALVEALNELGIAKLYRHQVEAIDAIMNSENVVIATGPASGKTLCYHLPTLQMLFTDANGKALYIYPTKALAQDQLRSFNELLSRCKVRLPARPFTYDGDTPATTRRKARNEGNVIFTNPDMLHSGILPSHERWGGFFSNLRIVVLDELHTYRGVFGSHVANVIRRLKRICAHYGCKPVFVCASATIANPKEHAERLLGEPVKLISEDASPCGRKAFVFWNPSSIPSHPHERRSANQEAAMLISMLVEYGWHTIAFTRTRNAMELTLRHAQDVLMQRRSKLAGSIRGYRAGYLPEERREIERELFSGQLMGVVATSALELGIDVGELDACVLIGYPGTIASFLQRSGRVGRGGDEAVVFFVAHNTPIDQYLMHHPEYIFERPPEHALIDPDNPHIILSHLRCAASELPMGLEELMQFGEYAPAVASLLEEYGELKRFSGRWYWHGRGFPAADVDLRNIGENTFTIVDVGNQPPRTIGTLDEYSAFKLVHPQAIYMHEGETYFVESLDLDKRVASVRQVDVDYFTCSISEVRIRVQSSELQKRWRISEMHCGRVTVTDTVFMFRKVKMHTWESIGYGRVYMPPVEVETHAAWLIPPKEALQLIRSYGRNPSEAILAVANVVAHVVPLFVMSDPSDVGTVVDSSNTGIPTLFIYDAHPGGVGIAQKVYEVIEEILKAANELITNCKCEDGCPACVGAPGWYARLPQFIDGAELIPDKEAARALLHELLELEPYIPRARKIALKGGEEGDLGEVGGIDGEIELKPLPEGVEIELRQKIEKLRRRRDSLR